MKTILVIGGCGSGKTWVMLQLVKLYNLNLLGKVGMIRYHRNLALKGIKLLVTGIYDGSTFQGSDRLSMAIMTDLPRFLAYAEKDKFNIVCEGDRFTNSTFINTCKPIIIKITDDGVKGRLLRGSTQTPRQIQTIATRVNNIAATHTVKDSKQALKLITSLLK